MKAWFPVTARMQTFFPIVRILFLLLVFAAQCVWAQDGLRGAATKSANVTGLRSSFTSKLAAADFDNDQKLDGALLLDAGVINGQRMFRIELHVSASEDRDLLFASNDASLAISALDVNRDGVPDLVVEQAFTNKRLQVWLNDGHGRFRRAQVEDYPPLIDASCNWQAPFAADESSVAGLPSRLDTDQVFLLLQALNFDLTSSYGKSRDQAPLRNALLLSSRSPRAPPLRNPV